LPFSSTSQWNLPLGSGAHYSAMASGVNVGALLAEKLCYVDRSSSIPSFKVSSADPLRTFSITINDTTTSPYHGPGTHHWRIPDSAFAAKGSDHSMDLLDPDGVTLHELWRASKGSTGNWTSPRAANFDIRGSGINDTGHDSGIRAAQVSQFGGLIRSHEITANRIPHALAMVLSNWMLKSGFVWPATAQDQSGGYTGEIPMGSLLAIPPSVDVTKLGLSPTGLAIAHAFQDYGGLAVDRNGGGGLTLQGDPTYTGTGLASVNSPFTAGGSELCKIVRHLQIVTNNTKSNPKGGGTPRVPLTSQ
jgi:hypothetical protein